MEKEKSLADKIKELEQTVELLNQNPEIEEALKLYENGVKLAASIRIYLEKAQTKIRVLTEEGEKSVDADKLGRKDS